MAPFRALPLPPSSFGSNEPCLCRAIRTCPTISQPHSGTCRDSMWPHAGRLRGQWAGRGPHWPAKCPGALSPGQARRTNAPVSPVRMPLVGLKDKATSLQTKERLLTVSRKPECITKEQWWRQWWAGWTISGGTNFRALAWMKPRIIIDNTQNSPQTCAWTVTLSVPERRNWKDKELELH